MPVLGNSRTSCFIPGLLLVLVYIISGKLGLLLALPPGYASAIFPPGGLAIAAFFIAGKRVGPAIFIGSLLLSIWVGHNSHGFTWLGFAAAVLIACASLLQAAVGGLTLRRVIGYPSTLDSPREVMRFFMVSPLICLLGASIAVTGLWALGVIASDHMASSWVSWWIGDFLALIVMLPLTMVVMGKPRAIWRKRLTTVALPMLIMFTVLIALFIIANRWEHKEALMEFEALSNELSEALEVRFQSQTAVLKQTSALFTYQRNDTVSRQDFHNFVQQTLIGFPMIYAIEWAPKVHAAQVPSFVAEQARDIPGFHIQQLGPDNGYVAASERSIYFPVTYVEPMQDSIKSLLGFDLYSLQDRKQVIEKAYLQKQAVVTPPTQLVIDRGEQTGLLLAYPVTGNGQDGLVFLVLRTSAFLKDLTQPIKQSINIRIVDVASGKAVYDGYDHADGEVLYTRFYEFGTRQFRLETSPTAFYLHSHRSWQSWSMLALGIFGTGMMGALLLLGTGYTSRVESLVEAKTAALKASEKSIREIIDFAPIGMAIVALDGRFSKVNQALCDILGYHNHELIALNAQQIMRIDEDSRDLALIRQLLQDEITSCQMEKRYQRRDGQQLWLQLTTSIFRDDANIAQYFIAQVEDITERKIALEEAQRHAHYDALTKLPNRRMLFSRLAQALSIAERYQRSMAVMFLDLDRFKSINDSLGHEAGDAILKEVARRLSSCVRSHDTVSRQGGDEFVIVVSEVNREMDVQVIAEKIISCLAAPIQFLDTSLTIGVSIGIAVRTRGHASSANDLLRHADMAMYQAKQAGRNGYRFYR